MNFKLIIILTAVLLGSLAQAETPTFSCATDSSDRVSVKVAKTGEGIIDVGLFQATTVSGANPEEVKSYIITIEKKSVIPSQSLSVSGSGGALDSQGHRTPLVLGFGDHFISCQLD